MSRKRQRPTLPTPAEVRLAPGDSVVLVSKRDPDGPFIFGEVDSLPVVALIPDERVGASRHTRALQRVWLCYYTLMAVDRGGVRIAKVQEPRRSGVWFRAIPDHPGLTEASWRSMESRKVSRRHKPFFDAGWAPGGVDGSWTYNKLDVHARVWYTGEESRWCFALLLGGAYTSRSSFRSDMKALSAAHTHILSHRPGTTPCPT